MTRHPNRCPRCGSNYAHLRGCSLEDLTLQPTQETNLRNNPEDVCSFDVDCLLHEIDRLRMELSEANRCWKAALEVQAELEAEILSLQKRSEQ